MTEKIVGCFGCGQTHNKDWSCPPYRRPYTQAEIKKYSKRAIKKQEIRELVEIINKYLDIYVTTINTSDEMAIHIHSKLKELGYVKKVK